ncbi:ComEC/Rec2 family competence protein [Streptoalloteichus hindustanus]|uniref:Competence protein ComEC n=1 Tax=Streptoalloteichus hindustanus TaxID=2017 RepID=A0A1M5BMH7_STRHI|nr:ComEC/Rec2 family competence protein [Streptoalloteichus hindustanus]SHF43711.1 competence protein ComEC [Streptoalloteichus hindustanus]
MTGATPRDPPRVGPILFWAKENDETPQVLDLRLVPAAAAAWAVTLVGLRVDWRAAAWCGVVALMVAMGLWARRRGRRGVRGVLVVCGVSAAFAAVVSVRVRHVAEHPLRSAAHEGLTAVLRVELDDDPTALRVPGYGERPAGTDRVAVAVGLRAAEITSRSGRTASIAGNGERVLLLAPGDWGGLLPGQQAVAQGQLAPATHGDLTVTVLRVRGPPLEVTSPPWWQNAAGTLRDGLRHAARRLDPEPAGLVPALVVGDTTGLPERVVGEFRAAGLTHLLAVSGANLAIVCGAVLLVCRLLHLGPRARGVLAGLAVVGFVVLARPEPSVLRAAVMAGVALLALTVGRPRSALPALAGSVLVLLLVDSGLAAAPGFALSVLATGALVLVAPWWVAALHRRGVPAGLAEALAVPAAAHLVTAPLVVALSGKVSLVAVVANLLAAPAVPPVTLLGVLAAVVAPAHRPTAELIVMVAGPPADWLVLVGRRAAAVPGAEFDWPSGALGGLALAVVAVAVLVALRFPRTRALLGVLLVGVVLAVVPTGVIRRGWPVSGWVVVACDVGQGDALVLATADAGRAVVVDSGPEPGAVDGCLRRLGVRRIPLVVLSHLHADHVGGLSAVLDGREVGAIALGPLHYPEWAAREVRQTAARANVPLLALTAGDRLEWPGLRLEVLGPPRAPTGPPPDADAGTPVNDASLVLRASTPAGRVLLTGDVELAGQSALLSNGSDLAAEVLKVPHHGSRSTLPVFLAAVRPRVALISVGAGNRYGHPSRLVVDALTSSGTRVLRTDQDGDIAVLAGQEGPATAWRGDPRAPPR